MSVLGAAVALIGVIAGLNLLLLYGVIRRLRTHSELLARVSGPPAAAGATLRAHVAPFSVTTVDGRSLRHDAVRAGTFVGFFAADCAPCAELLPRFIEAFQGRDGSAAPVLAVVAEGAGSQEYIARLQSVSTVIARADAKTVATAFGARGYPTLCQVTDGGAIRELSQQDLPALRQGAPA